MKLEDIEEVHYLGLREQEFEVVEGGRRFWKKGILEDWVSSDNDVAIVASDEEELVGFLLATYNQVTHKATIENAYVKPQYRNLFTAIRMYKEAETKLKEKGADFVCGFVELGNEASIRFLEKCGFSGGKTYCWMNKLLY